METVSLSHRFFWGCLASVETTECWILILVVINNEKAYALRGTMNKVVLCSNRVYLCLRDTKTERTLDNDNRST